jgi:hypothetical protein
MDTSLGAIRDMCVIQVQILLQVIIYIYMYFIWGHQRYVHHSGIDTDTGDKNVDTSSGARCASYKYG